LHGLNREPIANERQSKPVERDHRQHDGRSGANGQRTFGAEAQTQEYNMQHGMVGCFLSQDSQRPEIRFLATELIYAWGTKKL
jgi:hypothetical protein